MEHLEFLATPFYHLDNIRNEWGLDIYEKRDDRFYSGYGGNKARILQYMMYVDGEKEKLAIGY